MTGQTGLVFGRSPDREVRITSAMPDEGAPLATRVTADDFGRKHHAAIPASRSERRDAIRRLLALADLPDDETQIEHDLLLLGVPAFELFCAADVT